jgi:hypothetical protein
VKIGLRIEAPGAFEKAEEELSKVTLWLTYLTNRSRQTAMKSNG